MSRILTAPEFTANKLLDESSLNLCYAKGFLNLLLELAEDWCRKADGDADAYWALEHGLRSVLDDAKAKLDEANTQVGHVRLQELAALQEAGNAPSTLRVTKPRTKPEMEPQAS